MAILRSLLCVGLYVLANIRYFTQILDAMNQDSELPLNSVRVDGGMTENKLMLQLQADILGIKMGTIGRVLIA